MVEIDMFLSLVDIDEVKSVHWKFFDNRRYLLRKRSSNNTEKKYRNLILSNQTMSRTRQNDQSLCFRRLLELKTEELLYSPTLV